MIPMSRSLTVFCLVLLLTAGAAWAEVDRFEAIAQGTGKSGAAAGKSGKVVITVETYTDQAGRQKMIDVISGGDAREINRYIENLPRIGTIHQPGQLAIDLRYAYDYRADDGTRQVVLATDRSYLSATAPQQGGDTEYLMAVIALDLDAKGKGDGMIAPAVELKFVDGKLQATNAAADPITLTKVRAKQPKK